MTRLPLRTALAVRRPRRALWTPWRRTQAVKIAVYVALALALVAAITIARGIL